jgi:hypothetical protein
MKNLFFIALLLIPGCLTAQRRPFDASLFTNSGFSKGGKGGYSAGFNLLMNQRHLVSIEYFSTGVKCPEMPSDFSPGLIINIEGNGNIVKGYCFSYGYVIPLEDDGIFRLVLKGGAFTGSYNRKFNFGRYSWTFLGPTHYYEEESIPVTGLRFAPEFQLAASWIGIGIGPYLLVGDGIPASFGGNIQLLLFGVRSDKTSY